MTLTLSIVFMGISLQVYMSDISEYTKFKILIGFPKKPEESNGIGLKLWASSPIPSPIPSYLVLALSYCYCK